MELKLNKWIYGCVAVLMLAAAWIFTRIDGGEDTVRYEQHLEEPDEAGLGEKPQSDGLVTHLPIISIDTGGETIPGNAILNDSLSIVGTTKTADGKDHIMAHMEVISGEGWHQLSDTRRCHPILRFISGATLPGDLIKRITGLNLLKMEMRKRKTASR